MTPEWIQMMAQYNAWQNASLFAAADGLDDTARRLDRGAFFESIHGTLTHLYLGDMIWMSRFDGGEPPKGGISDLKEMVAEWSVLKTSQRHMDQRIIKWAKEITPAQCDGDLEWYYGAANRQVSKSRSLVFTQFFSHQTHHRGQTHAMLTAAGAKPDDTDLFLMPSDVILMDAS